MDLLHTRHAIVNLRLGRHSHPFGVFPLTAKDKDDRAYFGRIHDRWEKKLKDPNDVLIEAARLMEKRRKEAARKKAQRKRRGAGSKAV